MLLNKPAYLGPTMTLVSVALVLVALTACGDDGMGDAVDAGADNQTDAGPSSLVPSEPAALFAFLQARSYESFDAEPAVHASVGPHGQVRSFFDAKLSASLSAGNSEHPVGSATIKELYTGANLSGWAVMVKNGTGNTGADWYFYEVLSITDGSSPVADGQGVSGCVSCHSAASGFVLTDFP